MSKAATAPWQIGPSGVVLELLEARTRGRFTLPARATAGLAWLAPGAEALGVSEQRGRVRLLPWAAADAVRAKSDTLVAIGGDEAEEQLLLLHGRYLRLRIDQDARLDLPPALAENLEIASLPVMYLARIRERVELWSRSYHEQRLLLSARAFPDLP